jgi:hypothetical protein
MSEKIDTIEKASQLARAIASDLAVYNQAKIEEGLVNDTFFELLDDEIEEGRKLFGEKVIASIASSNIFECAIINGIVSGKRSLKTKIF